MRQVVVGYGECKGYRLNEIPPAFLEELSVRYAMETEQLEPTYDDLIITLAIHAELKRREKGGNQEPRVPSLRELAHEIVDHGFRQASKIRHPDGKGNNEAQIRLSSARDKLREACKNIDDDLEDSDAIVITEPRKYAARQGGSPFDGISDDDVPF